VTTADGGDRAVGDVAAFVSTVSVVVLSVGVVSGWASP